MCLLNACTILKKVYSWRTPKTVVYVLLSLRDPRVNRSELSEIKMSFDVYRHAPPRMAVQMRFNTMLHKSMVPIYTKLILSFHLVNGA